MTRENRHTRTLTHTHSLTQTCAASLFTRKQLGEECGKNMLPDLFWIVLTSLVTHCHFEAFRGTLDTPQTDCNAGLWSAAGCLYCYDLCPIVKEITVPYDGVPWFHNMHMVPVKKNKKKHEICIHDKNITIKDCLTFISQLDQKTCFNDKDGDRHNEISTSGKSCDHPHSLLNKYTW